MSYPHESMPEFQTESLLFGRLVCPVRTFCCMPSDWMRGLPSELNQEGWQGYCHLVLSHVPEG